MEAETIKKKNNLLQVALPDVDLKRVSSTNGGEYAGSCPFCGGIDRFRVQPYHSEGGRWWCRGCGEGRWHDVIDYVMRRNGIDFLTALDKLEGTTGKMTQPKKDNFDVKMWEDTALHFLAESIDALWSPAGAGALAYLENQRYLTKDTIRNLCLGYNPADFEGAPDEWGYDDDEKIYIPKGIVIPCQDRDGLHYLKVRRSQGDPKYLMVKGSQMWLFGAPTLLERQTAFLYEGEFDAMLSWQIWNGVGAIALPAGQPMKPAYSPFMQDVEEVITCFDNDDAGQLAAVKMAHLDHFHIAQPLPAGKDLTEFYQAAGEESVFEYVYSEVEKLNK
jgi:DNA primase